MNSIDQVISVQLGIILQVTGALTHTRFWPSNIFVDHYSGYYYTHRMRVTSAEETLWVKEAYERLASIHRARVYAYRADNGRFTEPLFNEAVQTFRKYIIYCGVGSHHQNAIVEPRIK